MVYSKKTAYKSSNRSSNRPSNRSSKKRNHHQGQNNNFNRKKKKKAKKKKAPNQQLGIRVHENDRPDIELVETEGILDVQSERHGFLRRLENCYAPDPADVLVPAFLIEKHELRNGVKLNGRGEPEGKGTVQGKRVLWEVDLVDGVEPDEARNYPVFSNLTSIDPNERFVFEGDGKDLSMRVLDFLTPIGRGQRGLIVSPPRAGKTILLQKIAQRVEQYYPDVHLMVLLIDERPEEATHFSRAIQGEVIYSTSDEPAAKHIKVSQLVIERAKRLVEAGRDVFLLMDSLTRLGRAYNVEIKNSGRTLSGGVDSRTLEKPKAFFGAARNAEESGSLTILATALIETGSRMDQVIFEEFKGTGNMELVLSRKLADRRIYPAIDINLSGTRKEELLIGEEQLKRVWLLRRVLNQMESLQGMTVLLDRLAKTETNDEFLDKFHFQ
jgi:transcription termination factor Rho